MSAFERTYQIDPSREQSIQTEKHPSIELSDEMLAAGWVYREPCKVDANSPEYLKQKQALAELLCKETKVITLNNEPPPIPMNLEMPILEDTIRKGKKNAKSKSKSTARKPKKDSSKSNRPAVESLQAQL